MIPIGQDAIRDEYIITEEIHKIMSVSPTPWRSLLLQFPWLIDSHDLDVLDNANVKKNAKTRRLSAI